MVILYVLVSLSLVFSLISLIILWQNHIGFSGNPILPTSTPTITPLALLSYNQASLQDMADDNTTLVLSFNLTLIQGSSRTLNYSQFSVSPYVPRGGVVPAVTMEYAHAYPQEKGIVTVDDNNPKRIFQLTFTFPTYGRNFDDYIGHFTGYDIKYNETILFSGQTNQTQI